MTEAGQRRGVDPSVELLQQWQSTGDRDVLDSLLRIEVALLRARIRRSRSPALGASASSLDFAQQAVLQMLGAANPPRFESAAKMHAYLWTVAKRLLKDRLRARHADFVQLEHESRSGVDVAIEESGIPSKVDRADRTVALHVVLNLLPDAERHLVVGVYLQGREVQQVAAELGIAPKAAGMRLVRARKKLARKLSSWVDLIG